MKLLENIALTAILSLSITSIAFAGGGHGTNDGSSGGHGSGGVGSAGKTSEVSRTIDIVMMDNYYEPEIIVIKAGETIRFKVSNNGVSVHEFNIGTSDMHKAHQEEMLMMAQHGIIQGGKINRELMKMDMGNGQTMEHNDPNSVLLASGEQAELIWTFPNDAELEFACNLPGHYQSGMVGEININ
jgi:uncharacterized cupredoxin-like copper-binding protein